MNKTFNTKKKDENRHKLTTLCFNKCIEWKLTASITNNKTSIGYVRILKLINFISDLPCEKPLFQTA